VNREETILNRAVWFGVFLSACLLVWVFVSQCWSAEPAQEPFPQCVQIHAKDTGPYWSHGTGAYIAPLLIVTCQHNVRDARRDGVTVEFPDGEVIKATILKEYPRQDVCFLTLASEPECQPMSIATDPLTVGEPLAIMGYVSGKYRRVWGTLIEKRYGTAAANWAVVGGAEARQGESGGPVINANGSYAGTLWGAPNGETCFTEVDWIVGKVLELDRELLEPAVDPEPSILYDED
jgi:S1-C subfamily serine protease